MLDSKERSAESKDNITNDYKRGRGYKSASPSFF